MSESGHKQGNLETVHAKRGTSPAVSHTPCGQFQSTIRAQFEHNKHNHSTMDRELPVDLRLVVNAWEKLPDAVKQGIVAMVKATSVKK